MCLWALSYNWGQISKPVCYPNISTTLRLHVFLWEMPKSLPALNNVDSPLSHLLPCSSPSDRPAACRAAGSAWGRGKDLPSSWALSVGQWESGGGPTSGKASPSSSPLLRLASFQTIQYPLSRKLTFQEAHICWSGNYTNERGKCPKTWWNIRFHEWKKREEKEGLAIGNMSGLCWAGQCCHLSRQATDDWRFVLYLCAWSQESQTSASDTHSLPIWQAWNIPLTSLFTVYPHTPAQEFLGLTLCVHIWVCKRSANSTGCHVCL